ncbi:MAG: protein-(glutamine-N5) methyltransferase, ribosomal protein L3-specific [Micavibrio sp.]|nr:protein-(glutamine-N5) methyltransferase, ribosomal protein L3-specific [Micavibrio sp.]
MTTGRNNAKSALMTDNLTTIRDFLRYAVSRFNQAELVYGHGTTTSFDEAAFIVLEGLHLPVDSLEPYLDAKLTRVECKRMAELIEARVTTRKPAAYLLNKAYIQGLPFYVDERVIVPRSFIAEILCDDNAYSPVDGMEDSIESVLDLCTGSGCLAILAATLFPEAQVDAVDLSADALEVAKRNVKDHGFEDRITLYQGDLFAPLEGKKYDLIITNPPYVDAKAMAELPAEYKHEPAMALGSGTDGMDIVRQILKDAPKYLNPGGGIICEIGQGRDVIMEDFPDKDFIWLDTVESVGEVFWLSHDE